MRRGLIALWSLCVLATSAAACDDVDFIALGELEHRTVVLARVGPSLDVLEVSLVHPGAAPTYFSASDGDSVHVFSLDSLSVRDAAGQALSSDELLALNVEVVHGGPGPGGCSSCSIPTDAPPFVLAPGDGCALPRYFEHQSNGDAPSEDELTAIRAQVRIVRPGDCPVCPSGDTGVVRGHFTACEAESGPKPHRWNELAVSDDGAIAAVHPSMILTATTGAAPVFHPLDDAYIRAPVIAAAGRSGRRFVAAGRVITVVSDTPVLAFYRAEGDTVEQVRPPIDAGSVVNNVLHDATRSVMFLFGFDSDGGFERAWRCSEDLRECADTVIPDCEGPRVGGRRNISNSLQLASGDIVAVSQEGFLFYLPRGSDTWECRLRQPSLALEGPFNGSATDVRVESFSESVVAGGRLFACGNGGLVADDPDTSFAVVLNAELASTGPLWHRGEVSLYVERASVHCNGMWHDRARGEVDAFFFRDETVDVLAFDLQGRFLGRRLGLGLSADGAGPRFPIAEQVAAVVESPDGRNRLIGGAHGSLYFQRNDGPLRAIGPESPERPAFAFPFAGLGDTVLIGGAGEPMAWDGTCGADSLAELAPLDGLIDAAAALPDGRIVVLARGEVLLYQRNVGVFDRRPLQVPVVRQAVALTADELILLDDGGEAHVLSLAQDSLQTLPLLETPGVASTRPHRFEYLSGGPGLGWLSSGDQLARVRPGESGLTGELWWGDRVRGVLAANEEPLETQSFGASSVLACGETAVFVRGVINNLDSPQYIARTVLLRPNALGTDYDARVLPGFSNQARFGASSFRGIARILSAAHNPVLGFDSGLVLRPDSEPWTAPNGELTSIVEMEDHLVITDRAGLRVFLRSP